MTMSSRITDGDTSGMSRFAAEDVLIGYADTLDRADFDAWADMFSEHGSYRLVPRMNVERGLPIALMSCANKAWVQDRAAAILHASVSSPHCYRHFYANLAVRPLEADRVQARCNYAVYRTVSDGDTDLLSVGRVEAVLSLGSPTPIDEMSVIYDTLRINGVLVFPL